MDTKSNDGLRLVRGKLKPEHFELTNAQRYMIKSMGVAELAKRSGLSRTIIYRLLDGDVPELTVPTVRKLAKALGLQDWQFLKLK